MNAGAPTTRVLLTGAGGWLGGNLARAFAEAGCTVFAMVRNGAAARQPGLAAVPGVNVVVCDPAVSTSGLPASYDWLVHAAAHAPPRPQTPRACLADNLIATQALIDHAARAKARGAVFTSTVSVYGKVDEPQIDEGTAVRDPGVYGLSKLFAERLFAETADTVPAIALRLPGLIGPRAVTPWLGRTALAIAEDLPVTLYNPDQPFNNAVHVTDLAAFLLRLFSRRLEGFDVATMGARDAAPLRAVVERMADALGRSARIEVRPAAQASFVVSSHHASVRYGYHPMGILDMAARFAREVTASDGSGNVAR